MCWVLLGIHLDGENHFHHLRLAYASLRGIPAVGRAMRHGLMAFWLSLHAPWERHGVITRIDAMPFLGARERPAARCG